MLVPSMNRKEISRELHREFEKITCSSTLDRIFQDYYHERKKLNIRKDAEYARNYEIRTKSKNNWIIIASKDVLIPKYHYPEDCALSLIMYYYTEKGICVFQTTPEGRVNSYYGHLFHRYRERMNLKIPDLLDVIKYYFKNNYLPYYKFLPQRDGMIRSIGLVKDGFILGEMFEEEKWCINKTFILKETANLVATSAEKEFINELDYLLKHMDRDDDPELYEDLLTFQCNLVSEEKRKLKIEQDGPPVVNDIKPVELQQKESDFVTFIKNQVKGK